MKTSNKTLALAALAGLLTAGAVANSASAAHIDENAAKTAGSKILNEKHACKGLNSCKGKGADGKNECKGKGSCATDK